MNTGSEKGEESSVIVSLQTVACDCHNREGCRARSRRPEKREMRRETHTGEKRQKGNQRTAESSEQRAAENHKINV